MKKKFNLTVLRVLICLAALYGSALLFNHVNAWMGIIAALIVVAVVANRIITIIQNNQKQ